MTRLRCSPPREEGADGAVRAVAGRTEGWPAGVYLTALTIRGGAGPGAAAAEIAGDDAFIADYFWEEVLARESPDVVRFLLRTAVLEQLSAVPCVTPCSRSPGQRLGWPTWPPGTWSWCRSMVTVSGTGYHRLFAEMLLASGACSACRCWSRARRSAPTAIRAQLEVSGAAHVAVWCRRCF